MTDVTLARATGPALEEVVALLSACDLPTDDVGEGEATFFLAADGDATVGCAGLEPCGDDALLRSVAVPERHRGRGYGGAIVGTVLDEARERGVDRLYLLTTTAAPFFADHGFERVAREDVPPAVQSTREFRALCPDDATAMRTRL